MTRIRSLAGRPIEQHSSPNIGGRMSGHHGLVLHIAEGTYRGTISWQMNPDQRYQDGTRVTTSSTWIVGRDWGEWAQMADTETVAWCQRSGSRTWHSVELEGFAPAAPTPWQIEACAQLLAWEHRTHGVPLAIADHPGERGLGHHSMDREWLGEQWGHEACPGAGVLGAKQQIVRRAQAIAAGNTETPGGLPMLMECKFKDESKAVGDLQDVLHYSFGLDLGSYEGAPDGVDEEYGPKTAAALAKVIGGDGKTFGRRQRTQLLEKFAAKFGGGGSLPDELELTMPTTKVVARVTGT